MIPISDPVERFAVHLPTDGDVRRLLNGRRDYASARLRPRQGKEIAQAEEVGERGESRRGDSPLISKGDDLC
jgi:hypothetical protein